MSLKYFVKEYRNTLESLLNKMIKHHNIELSDLKPGDLRHGIIKGTEKEYFIIYNKFCYELIKTFKDNTIELKLIPNQSYLVKEKIY